MFPSDEGAGVGRDQVDIRDCSLSPSVIRTSCRPLDPGRHPVLGRMTRDEIYDHGAGMAPGGLVLADMLAAELQLEAGSKVLDIGCGRGQSSLFLASRHGAQVLSVDLWISAEERRISAERAGVGALITPLQGDICRGVPIEAGSLDAIFSMQAFHCFGTRPWLLNYLASLLKPGGIIGIAQGCFRQEPLEIPALFQKTDGWRVEYEKYHSPDWWHDHFASHPELDVRASGEVRDGDLLWEDDVLYRCERAGWASGYIEQSAWLIRQIIAGRNGSQGLTHCLVAAMKRQQLG